MTTPHPQGARTAQRSEPGRIFALDTARFVAVIGMVAAHVSLIPIPGLNLPIEGPPSTLFAVLGGVSAVLATRGRAARSGQFAAATALVVRGLVLVLLGVALQGLSGPITVVLVPFGVTLILLAPLLRVPTLVLLEIIAALAVVGPIANAAIRDALQLETLGALSFDSAWSFLSSVTFTGTYPVITWLTYALAGVVLARVILQARTSGTTAELGRRLLVWGIVASAVATVISVLAVQFLTAPRLAELGIEGMSVHLFALMPSFGGPLGGGVEAVLTAAPHSGSTADIVRTGGLAIAVIGFFLRREASAGVSDRLVPRIVRAGGAAPLTLYVAHVLCFGVLYALVLSGGAPDASLTWLVQGGLAFAIQVLLLLAISATLALTRSRGPLETILSTLSSRVGDAAKAVQ